VLLGGDDDQRAAIELARRLRAVDELPQPRLRGLRVTVVAVVDPQPAAAAVLAGLCDVAAQLVDDEADAAGGDPGDPLPRLGVGGTGVVGAEQRADEEPRDVDVAGVDGREVVDERVAEIEVRPVRLVGQLPELRVTLPLRRGYRVRRLLVGAGGLLLLRDCRRLGVDVVVGALDGALGEFAVERPVDDDRPAALVMPRRWLCRAPHSWSEAVR
jgi:hypothetical protein